MTSSGPSRVTGHRRPTRKCGVDRLRQHLAPYSRYVRGELSHLEATRAEMDQMLDRLEALAARVAAWR